MFRETPVSRVRKIILRNIFGGDAMSGSLLVRNWGVHITRDKKNHLLQRNPCLWVILVVSQELSWTPGVMKRQGFHIAGNYHTSLLMRNPCSFTGEIRMKRSMRYMVFCGFVCLLAGAICLSVCVNLSFGQESEVIRDRW